MVNEERAGHLDLKDGGALRIRVIRSACSIFSPGIYWYLAV